MQVMSSTPYATTVRMFQYAATCVWRTPLQLLVQAHTSLMTFHKIEALALDIRPAEEWCGPGSLRVQPSNSLIFFQHYVFGDSPPPCFSPPPGALAAVVLDPVVFRAGQPWTFIN